MAERCWNLIKVNTAEGLLIFRDRFNRLKIFKELDYRWIYALMDVFRKEEMAIEKTPSGGI